MERLTKTYQDGTHRAADNLPCGENSWDYKALLLERLGIYEDTGLTPEEIMDGKLLTGWIPVEEKLPDNDNDVIVSKSDGIIDIAFWNGDVWRSLDSNYTLNVLAWTPLPEPYNPLN